MLVAYLHRVCIVPATAKRRCASRCSSPFRISCTPLGSLHCRSGAICRFALSLLSDHPLSLLPHYLHANLNSWVYLVFFNGLWVVFPVWILYEAYKALSSAMSQSEMVDLVNYLKKDD